MNHRVFIVEDHPLMRESLVLFLELEPGLEPCGTAESAEEALVQLPDADVDLVLVDVMLPGISGIDLVRQLRAQRPALRCLMISGHERERYEKAALDAGAVGYVMKDNADAVIDAIRKALHRPDGGLVPSP